MPLLLPLPSLGSRSFLLISRSSPRLPLLASFSSWRSREAGWLGLLSLRLPGLWLLRLRHISSPEKLSRLGLRGLP
jgi:hypothetical protein